MTVNLNREESSEQPNWAATGLGRDRATYSPEDIHDLQQSLQRWKDAAREAEDKAASLVAEHERQTLQLLSVQQNASDATRALRNVREGAAAAIVEWSEENSVDVDDLFDQLESFDIARPEYTYTARITLTLDVDIKSTRKLTRDDLDNALGSNLDDVFYASEDYVEIESVETATYQNFDVESISKS